MKFIVALIVSLALAHAEVDETLHDPSVTFVRTPYSAIELGDIPKVIQRAQLYFQEVGIVLRLRTLEVDDALCPNDDWQRIIDELECYARYMEQNLPQRAKRVDLYHFFIKGWTSETGRHLFGGRARTICTNVSMGTADYLWYSGAVDSFEASGDIAAHEIFHSMCATHTEPWTNPSIMSRGIHSGWVKGQIVPVLDITKHQVKRWYADVRKWQVEQIKEEKRRERKKQKRMANR